MPQTYNGPCPDHPHANTAWHRHPLKRLDITVAVLCFAAALTARAPFIQRGETLLHSDEAIVGLMAQDIAAGRRYPIYFYGQRYMGALEAYAVAAASPLFDNPIHALRFAPACFFALMVAVQYLLLTRWFSRRGGLMGALSLIACSPMFMQWSISARGGYVEILLWGSALLWAYSEWFVPPAPTTRRGLRKFAFGALIGSGMWINPSIILFLTPIVAHALLNRPLAAIRDAPNVGPMVKRLTDRLQRASLPLAIIAGILLLNVTASTWVADGQVHNELLLGLLPKPLAMAILATLAAAALYLASRRTRLVDRARSLATANGLILLGILVGAAPAELYVLQTTLGPHAMDPSLPLGMRPLWLAGDTLVYLITGLPLLFHPDARPFLQLVGVGRDTVTQPLGIMMSGAVAAAAWLAIGALGTGTIVLLHRQRDGLSRLFRLRPANHEPATFLMIGAAGTIGLYVMGGCTLDFTTIRYLVPLWVFLPGLMAAVFVSRRFRLAATAAPLCACLAWAVGQFAMARQLGAPHPLRRVATSLVDNDIRCAVAEPLDAHLLSYLTRQRCRVIEFESFWPRLGHYFPLMKPDRPMDYIVQTTEIDRTWDWIDGGWPGQTPPETKRFLWPKLRRAIQDRPELLERRQPLPDGYERIRRVAPLPDRNAARLAAPPPEALPNRDESDDGATSPPSNRPAM